MAHAAALAALVRGISDDCEVFTFSHVIERKPARRGMALIDAIRNTDHSGTYLGQAVQAMNEMNYDRLVVFTDEQSADRVPAPKGVGYMINVASYQNGVGYGAWTHIDGFSEATIRFIQEIERGLEQSRESES